MRLLFAMTISAFCAVLWSAFALARRIQRYQGIKRAPLRRPAAREFFEAGEFRTPRSLTLNQEIHRQSNRSALLDTAFASGLQGDQSAGNAYAQVGEISRVPASEFLTPPLSRASFNKDTGRITRIDSPLQPAVSPAIAGLPSTPLGPDTDLIDASSPPALIHLPNQRVPPSPDRVSGLRRRIDLTHYTKDMGDLTDPSYNHTRRGSGMSGPASIHRRDH